MCRQGKSWNPLQFVWTSYDLLLLFIELRISQPRSLSLLETRMSICYYRNIEAALAHEEAREDREEGSEWLQILHEEG